MRQTPDLFLDAGIAAGCLPETFGSPQDTIWPWKVCQAPSFRFESSGLISGPGDNSGSGLSVEPAASRCATMLLPVTFLIPCVFNALAMPLQMVMPRPRPPIGPCRKPPSFAAEKVNEING